MLKNLSQFLIPCLKCLILSLILNGCRTRVVDIEKLIEKKGVYFEQGYDSPFTGKGLNFYPSGEKETEINLLAGVADGPWSTWNQKGILIRTFQYKNGQIVKFETFYDDGKKHLLAEYQNDLPHGKNIFWRRNGTKKFDVDFRHGKKHGEEKRWYSNGQLAIDAEYKDGKKVKATYWDKKGQVIKEINGGK